MNILNLIIISLYLRFTVAVGSASAWRRSADPATSLLGLGFPYTWFVENVMFNHLALRQAFDNWPNRTFIVWATTILAMAALYVSVIWFLFAGPAKGF